MKTNVGIEENLRTHFAEVGFKPNLIEHMEMADSRRNTRVFREFVVFDQPVERLGVRIAFTVSADGQECRSGMRLDGTFRRLNGRDQRQAV